ncbi:hypothetical protein [Sphaerotilus uruguayifluvii]|uniref:Uncharacterized protein n=1 Tax=Sphaerotilus uruguayifluvii TaxID=2735897 RepID=A0ABX2G008_9BURK|nr:hypothetical protein [Leptothrix sp. C29]NRT55577.1 hypothetical protein [Leptothrix sp. C29]
MAADPRSIRRRATVAVLDPLLDEASLHEALWLQHDTMRADQVSDIIGFVDRLAARHLFDAATVKRLYSDLYKALREREDRLPADPWAAMQAARAVEPPAAPPEPPAPAVAPPPPPAAPVINPVERALQAARLDGAVGMAAAVPAPVPRAPESQDGHGPAVVLFAALVGAVVAEVRRFHAEALDEVRRDVLRRADSAAASPALRLAFRTAWARPLDSDWRLAGSAGDLADLVRVLHVALVEAFGRNGAEQILGRGLRAAEALPEAAALVPRRLLETIPGLRL